MKILFLQTGYAHIFPYWVLEVQDQQGLINYLIVCSKLLVGQKVAIYRRCGLFWLKHTGTSVPHSLQMCNSQDI